MSKKVTRIRPKERQAIETALEQALTQLKNNASDSFARLLTENERLMVGRRVLISNLIAQGYTQMEVNNLLNVSPNTFTKIKRWLETEVVDFATISSESSPTTKENADNKPGSQHPHDFRALQKKYPLHFLLFTLSEKIVKDLQK